MKEEEETKEEDASSPLIEDEDMVKEWGNEDQHLERSHEEAVVEQSSIQYFVEETKEDDILSPLLKEDDTFEDEDKGFLENEVKKIHVENQEAHEDQEASIEESEEMVNSPYHCFEDSYDVWVF